MAVMRLYWMNAVVPELQEVLKNMRTISMSNEKGGNAGYGMFIEHGNSELTLVGVIVPMADKNGGKGSRG